MNIFIFIFITCLELGFTRERHERIKSDSIPDRNSKDQAFKVRLYPPVRSAMIDSMERLFRFPIKIRNKSSFAMLRKDVTLKDRFSVRNLE